RRRAPEHYLDGPEGEFAAGSNRPRRWHTGGVGRRPPDRESTFRSQSSRSYNSVDCGRVTDVSGRLGRLPAGAKGVASESVDCAQVRMNGALVFVLSFLFANLKLQLRSQHAERRIETKQTLRRTKYKDQRPKSKVKLTTI